jgi:uncharacterized protein YndB with AHSA1/START domain
MRIKLAAAETRSQPPETTRKESDVDATLHTINDRPALRFERRVPYPVERVWQAVTMPAELERWFPGVADWKPEAGEVFQVGGEQGEISEFDPPHLIAWTFAGKHHRVELQAQGSGCLLTFTYVFDDRPAAAQWAAGWDTYLNRLEPHLAGGFLSEEDAHIGFVERNDHYAERFGLDPEIGRTFWRAQTGA